MFFLPSLKLFHLDLINLHKKDETIIILIVRTLQSFPLGLMDSENGDEIVDGVLQFLKTFSAKTDIFVM